MGASAFLALTLALVVIVEDDTETNTTRGDHETEA